MRISFADGTPGKYLEVPNLGKTTWKDVWDRIPPDFFATTK